MMKALTPAQLVPGPSSSLAMCVNFSKLLNLVKLQFLQDLPITSIGWLRKATKIIDTRTLHSGRSRIYHYSKETGPARLCFQLPNKSETA